MIHHPDSFTGDLPTNSIVGLECSNRPDQLPFINAINEPKQAHDDDQMIMPCKTPEAFEWKLNQGWDAENRLQQRIHLEESTLESQFYPELESHICTWLGNQLSDAIKRKASNRCATPSAGVMLTEYYFSVFPTPDAQAAQLSNYIRRPYNQATTASGVIQNLELWKVSIQIHREVAGLMLSLSDMRKAFFHIIQPVVHDEVFDFALKMAREANLDARAISEEDTFIFFKRIVAKLHGVNLNKEFSNPKKRLLPVETPHQLRVVENQRARALHYQKK